MGIRNGKEKEKVTGLNGQDHPRKEKKKKKQKGKEKRECQKDLALRFSAYIHTCIHTLAITSSRSSDISAGFFFTAVIFLSFFWCSYGGLGSVRETRQAERKWDANGGHWV